MIKKKDGFQEENMIINNLEKRKNNIPATQCPILWLITYMRGLEKKGHNSELIKKNMSATKIQ